MTLERPSSMVLSKIYVWNLSWMFIMMHAPMYEPSWNQCHFMNFCVKYHVSILLVRKSEIFAQINKRKRILFKAIRIARWVTSWPVKHYLKSHTPKFKIHCGRSFTAQCSWKWLGMLWTFYGHFLKDLLFKICKTTGTNTVQGQLVKSCKLLLFVK